MMYLIRCKYVAMYDELAGVGYLDAHSRCTSELRNAKTFKSEAEVWDFAIASGCMVGMSTVRGSGSNRLAH